MSRQGQSYDRLTLRQQNLLSFIAGFMDREGFPPTLREIIHHTDFTSTSVVDYNLNALVEKGFLERERWASRGIRLVNHASPKADRRYVSIPLFNRILRASHSKIPASHRSHDVPSDWLRDVRLEQVYGVQVQGHLMYDAMVTTGDVLVVSQQDHANDGDTAVVIFPPLLDMVRIRRIRCQGDQIHLLPLIRSLPVQRLWYDQLTVVGRVLGLLREF